MIVAAAITGALPIIAGCGDGSRTSGDAAGQTVYKHSLDAAPTTLDPARAATTSSNFIVLNAYDTLYAYKYLARPYELKSNLAAALPEVSADGQTYTIRLKPGVHFIDDEAFAGGTGREVVARDFVYSIQRHFDPKTRARGAWLWRGRIEGLDDWKQAGSDYDAPVPGLEALDDHTLQVSLTRPYPQFVHTLAMGFAALVPREAVEYYGAELGIHPVGSGPFRVERFDSTRAVMTPNPRFRAEPVSLAAEGFAPELHAGFGLEAIEGRAPPFVDRIEVHFVAEGAARWNSFTKGNEIQSAKIPAGQFDTVLSTKTPPVLKTQLEPKYHMLASVEPGVIIHNFNMDFEEFGYNPNPQRNERNKALRCAMRKAFDWSARNEHFRNGIAAVYPGIIPPAVPEFDPELSRDSVTRDIEGAKTLLAEHGWTAQNLPTLEYGASATLTQLQLYEQFRGMMGTIDYPSERIVLKQYASLGDLTKALKQGSVGFMFKAWNLDYPDAENVLQLFYGPNRSPGSNDANFSDPEFDRLYEQSSVMEAGPERTQIYARMNRIVIDSCVAMSGLSRTNLLMWHRNVIGYLDRNIVGGFWLRYVDIEERPQ